MLHNALAQFLRDTAWGELDYLVIDMPPGTGDVAISLSQLLPLTGAVVVCTPQDVALLDAGKAIAMFRKVHIDVVGMVENMSFFVCPNCRPGTNFRLRRRAAAGGGMDVPFLGEVPIHTPSAQSGRRRPRGRGLRRSGCRPYLEAICRNFVGNLAAEKRASSPKLPALPVLGG